MGEQQNRNYLNSLKRVSTPLKETDRIYQVLTANHDRDDVLNFGLSSKFWYKRSILDFKSNFTKYLKYEYIMFQETMVKLPGKMIGIE